MNRARLVAFLIAALPLAASAAAIDQLRAFVSDTRAARGEFTQKQQRADGRAGETLSGRFAFQRPGRFRWDVARPYAQLMVADGERIWFHDPDLNQVSVRKLGDAIGGSPAAILFGSNDLERNFTLKEAGRREGLEWLDAVPRSREAGFERVSIGFREGLPEAMEIRDSFGQTTSVRFSGVERNPRLAADAFRFQPPKGADVVEQ